MNFARSEHLDDMKTSDKHSDWKLFDVHRFFVFVLDRTYTCECTTISAALVQYYEHFGYSPILLMQQQSDCMAK